MADTTALNTTPLHALHIQRSARMVPFAGYDMPVQYADGVLKEHLWTRAHAGLFDVSHMGQAVLVGPDHETTALALEALTPANLLDLKPGRMRYTVLLSDIGGIVDDLMVTRPLSPADDGRLLIVWNASRKDVDVAHVTASLPEGVGLETIDDRALIALQGPSAATVLAKYVDGVEQLSFMSSAPFTVSGDEFWVSRSGYTGEDGFEISVPASAATAFAEALLSDPEVRPIGLGARDSLRLEAGLCLYGADLDETTSPPEANLNFTIAKARRAGGARAGGFPSHERILREYGEGADRLRVGLAGHERTPVRAGAVLFASETSELAIGKVTSGTFSPTLNKPIAMAYVEAGYEDTGETLYADVRGKRVAVDVVDMPFVPHRYKR